MDYCEDMLNYLCLAIETNKNEMLNRIFEEITENCNEIFALAGVSNIEIDDDELILFIEELKKVCINNPSINIEQKEKDEIKYELIDRWKYASIYSFLYSIYNMGRRLQRDIVYSPELFLDLKRNEAKYLLDIYSNKYIIKEKDNEMSINQLICKKLCSVDGKDRVFLTNMGMKIIKFEKNHLIELTKKGEPIKLVEHVSEIGNYEHGSERVFQEFKNNTEIVYA